MQTIREFLRDASTQTAGQEVLRRHSYYGLHEPERKALRSQGYELYQGKVREVVKKKDRLFLFHTDRLSAFDRYVGMVPYKGTILTAITEFWLKEAAKIVPTHFKHKHHERVLEVEAMTPIKAEVIVRGYLAGSMARAYEKGEREYCGVKLPDGLKAHQELPQPIITPTTKAEVYQHDENTTAEELIAHGLVSADEWKTIQTMALKLFAHGQKVYREKGWLLVDTKYEFGRGEDGTIKLIDEIHTPDSSRLWVASNYEERMRKGLSPEMLDKEVIRRYLVANGFQGEGDVPDVPVQNLLALAEVYLTIAESLLDEPLMTEGPLKTSPHLEHLLDQAH